MRAAKLLSARLVSARLVSARVVSAGALAVCAGLLGCEDFSHYTTGPDESYCGSVTLGSAFRTGVSPRVQMRLKLDGARIDGAESPGTITTYEAPDGATAERRVLAEAVLRPIAPMLNDPLSHLDFGEGRERNAIYAVSPADPEAESMLAIVSLRSDDGVEVRLVRAGASPEAGSVLPEGRKTIFGIFPLTRQKGQCGF